MIFKFGLRYDKVRENSEIICGAPSTLKRRETLANLIQTSGKEYLKI